MENILNHIAIKELKIAYKGSEILNVSDIEIKAGKVFCLIGPNGSGKTSLLNAIAGIDQFTGDIEITSKNIKKLTRKELSKLISYTPSHNPENAIKVSELLEMNRFPHTNFLGKLKEQDHEIIKRAIELTKVNDLIEKNFTELSDGEKKKVMIAGALVQDCSIMMMDEPTNFLDIGNKYQFAQLIKRINTELNKTLLISTHDMDLAFHVADEFLLIIDQKLIKLPKEEVRNSKKLEEVFKAYNMQTDAEGKFKFD